MVRSAFLQNQRAQNMNPTMSPHLDSQTERSTRSMLIDPALTPKHMLFSCYCDRWGLRQGKAIHRGPPDSKQTRSECSLSTPQSGAMLRQHMNSKVIGEGSLACMQWTLVTSRISQAHQTLCYCSWCNAAILPGWLSS